MSGRILKYCTILAIPQYYYTDYSYTFKEMFEITDSAFRDSILEGVTVDDTAGRLVKLLKEKGYGVLGDISFDRVLKEKTGKDIAPIRLIEVCKPPFALAAIEANRDLAQVMPCRVTLFSEKNGTRISLFRPTVAMGIAGGRVDDIASQVESELTGAISELEKSVEVV